MTPSRPLVAWHVVTQLTMWPDIAPPVHTFYCDTCSRVRRYKRIGGLVRHWATVHGYVMRPDEDARLRDLWTWS